MEIIEKHKTMKAFIWHLICILRDNNVESAWKQFQTDCNNFANIIRKEVKYDQ
jgi:hypothetical protein